LAEALGQDRLHRPLADLASQTQQLHIFFVRSSRLLGQQGIIGAPKCRRRIEILSIYITGESSGLTHQPTNHVPVVDAMFVLATQPFHALHQLLRVPHLDLRHADPRLDFFTAQPRRH
jgi:hypothetical protein